MKKLEYQVSFTTPAFLGNAEQQAQWRTPPFKMLIRQWWRVAYAAEHGFNVDMAKMRREEGMLFGNAWLSHREGNREVTDHRKSRVRIRLDRWDIGELSTWDGLEQPAVHHPEVERTNYKVGPHAYLGYGPLDGRGNTKLAKPNAAIQAGEAAKLSVAFPEEHASVVEHALWLIDRYGTVGGRSRNGWGSALLTPLNGTPNLAGRVPSRPYGEALKIDWPHAIGRDETAALIWTTKPFDEWKQLMRELAIIKIGLRTQFVFPNVKPPHENVEPRHWLSYPITTHMTRVWDRGARLPNSLRFKVVPHKGDPKKCVGAIFHVPCRPPEAFRCDAAAIAKTWQAVYTLLDELTRPVQSRTYPSITDTNRREKLIEQLKAVTLARAPE